MRLFSLFCLLFTLTGCLSYKQVSVDKHTFYNNTKVPDKIDRYNIYVHDGQSLYRLDDQTFHQDTLRGNLTTVPAETVNAHPETRRELRASRKDLHVYLSKPKDQLHSEIQPLSGSQRSVTAIDRNSVDRVDMFTVNEKHIFMQAGYVILLLGLGVLIIFGLIAALAKGSEQATNDSGSNSNSDSGGSDSGGSDSGCYIATMVYGSYDAPSVMVLRRFRDHFLQKFAAGRRFISWYYLNSPGFVQRNRDRRFVNASIRLVLTVFVWLLRPFFGK